MNRCRTTQRVLGQCNSNPFEKHTCFLRPGGQNPRSFGPIHQLGKKGGNTPVLGPSTVFTDIRTRRRPALDLEHKLLWLSGFALVFQHVGERLFEGRQAGVALFSVDHDVHADFTGRDHLDIDPRGVQGLEHPCADAGMAADADPSNREDSNLVGAVDFATDPVESAADGLAFNRIVTMRDTWAKISGG